MLLFIGNFIEVLQVYHESLGVDKVISEKDKVDDSISDYCKKNNVSLYLVDSSDHLKSYLSSVEKCDLCIVASFGLLLDSSFLKRTKYTVNIHPGSLETCRGRHPLPFAIEQGLSFMGITAHIIEDEKIDNGPVVATLSLPIDYEESYAYNDEKLRSCLSFLTEFIVTQYKNETRILTGNIDLGNAPYNKRLDGETLNKMMKAKNLMEYKNQSRETHNLRYYSV